MSRAAPFLVGCGGIDDRRFGRPIPSLNEFTLRTLPDARPSASSRSMGVGTKAHRHQHGASLPHAPGFPVVLLRA